MRYLYNESLNRADALISFIINENTFNLKLNEVNWYESQPRARNDLNIWELILPHPTYGTKFTYEFIYSGIIGDVVKKLPLIELDTWYIIYIYHFRVLYGKQ